MDFYYYNYYYFNMFFEVILLMIYIIITYNVIKKILFSTLILALCLKLSILGTVPLSLVSKWHCCGWLMQSHGKKYQP